MWKRVIKTKLFLRTGEKCIDLDWHIDDGYDDDYVNDGGGIRGGNGHDLQEGDLGLQSSGYFDYFQLTLEFPKFL